MEPKKRSLAAAERDEFLRAASRALVDEMGANVSLSGLHAWSRSGKRAFGSAPRNWGKNVTLLSSDRVRKAAENLASASACCRGNNI